MARLMKRHLPHTVDLQPVRGETPEGITYGDWIEGVPAYVEQKSRLVVDRRTTSETAGAQVTATTQVVVLPDADQPPGTRIRVWAGTPRERVSEIIDSALGMYNTRTPNHVEFYVE